MAASRNEDYVNVQLRLYVFILLSAMRVVYCRLLILCIIF